MPVTFVVGIDPGLVHTGVVVMQFDRDNKTVVVQPHVIAGPDAQATAAAINNPKAHVFIEGYRPRSNFGTDQNMVTAVADIKRATHGNVLNNTGVKRVVKQELMELLGVWRFSAVTHHQDLRSAARIALLGMLKDDHLNQLLFELVTDHLDGRTWDVHS